MFFPDPALALIWVPACFKKNIRLYLIVFKAQNCPNAIYKRKHGNYFDLSIVNAMKLLIGNKT
jgi:hypothetical protein